LHFLLGSSKPFRVVATLHGAVCLQLLACGSGALTRFVKCGAPVSKRNDTASSHSFRLGSGLGTGGSGNATHQLVELILFLLRLLLECVSALLDQLALGHVHDFPLTLLSNCHRSFAVRGLLLGHLQLHLTRSGVLFRFDLLECQQINQVLLHGVALLQRCGVATVCSYTGHHVLVNHGASL
jgi:hypothetical protein